MLVFCSGDIAGDSESSIFLQSYMCKFIKGTVARDFLVSVFFHGSTPLEPQILRIKGFSFLSCFCEAI